MTEAAPTVEQDIEALLRMARENHTGDDDYEDALQRWRDRRGEDAFDRWLWWWRTADDENYQSEATTRQGALDEGRRDAPGMDIHLIEACLWNDDIGEGEDVSAFARSRNYEIVEAKK